MTSVVAKLTIVYVSLMVISLMFVGLSNAKIDPKSVVGMWLFDEGKGDTAKDLSENGNDGKLMGSPEWIEGKFGEALKFDGAKAYVEIGDNPVLAPDTGQLTVVAWVFVTGVGKVSIMENNAANWGFRYAEPGVPRLNGYIAVGGSHQHVYAENTPTKEWVHDAFVWDGKKGKLYSNGKVVAEAAISGPMDQPLGKGFTIARRGSDNASQYFPGSIDEVAIFNVALSSDEILDIINKGFKTILVVSEAGKLTTTWGKIKKLR